MSNQPTLYNRGRFQLKYRGTECLNCGHPLDISDRYCPNCSQPNTTKKLSIGDFFDEFFSNVISYDSRLLRSLSAMLLRPGRITKDFVEGKRMRYTNPFRFMLSLAIIYFLMLGLSGDFSNMDRISERSDTGFFDPERAIELALDDSSPEQVQAIQTLDSLNLSEQISRSREQQDSLILVDPTAHFNKITGGSLLERMGKKYDFFSTLIRKDSVFSYQEAMDKYAVESSMENKMSFSIAGSIIRVSRQPGSFANSLISKLPFATFFFLPVFALFIVLAYIRKKYTYTDNLIFSFHNQSLLFILLIISFLIDAVFNTSTAGYALLIFAVYLYKAMRNFYGQGRFKTLIKYLFLNTIYFLLAGMAGLIFILASAFTY